MSEKVRIKWKKMANITQSQPMYPLRFPIEVEMVQAEEVGVLVEDDWVLN